MQVLSRIPDLLTSKMLAYSWNLQPDPNQLSSTDADMPTCGCGDSHGGHLKVSEQMLCDYTEAASVLESWLGLGAVNLLGDVTENSSRVSAVAVNQGYIQ